MTRPSNNKPATVVLVITLVGFSIVIGSYLVRLTRNKKVEKPRSAPKAVPNKPDSGPPSRGSWVQTREVVKPRSALATLPYLSTQQPSPEPVVATHLPKRTYPGLNLYTSAHSPEARLIDMHGALLHRWHLPRDTVFPEAANKYPDWRYWRHVHVFPNGDLLALYEQIGLVRIDSASKIIWSYQGAVHHGFDLDHQHRVFVLDRVSRLVPGIRSDRPVLVDRVTVVDGSSGAKLAHYDIVDCLMRSPYAGLVEFAGLVPSDDRGDLPPDPFHTNSVRVLRTSRSSRPGPFKRGNLLLSIRQLNSIVVIDPAARRAVWALSSGWLRQHDASLLRNGNLMLFDNNIGVPWERGRIDNHRSRVVEVNPVTQRVVWEYKGTATRPFFSAVCGAAQRLPNGNTLVTESDFGRALEVTPDGRIAWEFNSPHRAGEQDQYVALLLSMSRLPPSFPIPGRQQK